jgi:hypothetical protein
MVATRRLIRELREAGRMRIDSDLEALILERLGSEPYPHSYTEQDLLEQIRKLVNHYGAPEVQPLRGAELAKSPSELKPQKGGERQ